MREVLDVEPAEALVYQEGWQSWSPTTTYRVTDDPCRPVTQRQLAMGFRGDAPPAADAFQGEGLLAVRTGLDDVVHVFAAPSPESAPSITARLEGARLVVESSGEVGHQVVTLPTVEGALGEWARGFAAGARVPHRAHPRVWCTWYHYYWFVTQENVRENLCAIRERELPFDVVQVDDGYQAGIGDWLTPSERFESIPGMVDEIRSAGFRAGIWLAPFLVGSASRLAHEHPEWLVPDVSAGTHWEQDLRVLDTTHPGAAEHLTDVLRSFVEMGVDYVKVDFVYAGALEGRRHREVDGVTAYRDGMRLIREAIGDAYLLGSGAPIVPSVGLVDAMRVSPDIAFYYEPMEGMLNEPGQRSAVLTGGARRWQNGVWWTSDPDCLIARAMVERREEWAEFVMGYGGLRSCSDRIIELDEWGLATTRAFLAE